MKVLISAVNAFAEIIILLLIARAICSWFIKPGSQAYRLYMMLEMITEPIVAPCRKITSRFRTGMIDFSVLLAFLLVIVIRNIVIWALLLFA